LPSQFNLRQGNKRKLNCYCYIAIQKKEAVSQSETASLS
jgi:hypothetical protein